VTIQAIVGVVRTTAGAAAIIIAVAEEVVAVPVRVPAVSLAA
jgi:hypothetical protein